MKQLQEVFREAESGKRKAESGKIINPLTACRLPLIVRRFFALTLGFKSRTVLVLVSQCFGSMINNLIHREEGRSEKEEETAVISLLLSSSRMRKLFRSDSLPVFRVFHREEQEGDLP